jgi:hypothetical protein
MHLVRTLVANGGTRTLPAKASGMPLATPGALWAALVVVSLASACQDPCVELAQRICNCESTALERRACIADRITSQQGRIVIGDADRELCIARLETCSCAALDENNLDACGFVPASAAESP